MAVRRAWTLRRRLIVGIVCLLAAVSIVIGAVSTVALRGYLIDRLDDQITAAAARFQGVADRPPGDGPPRPPGDDRPAPGEVLPIAGLPPGTLGAFIRSDGSVAGAVLGEDLRSTPLTDQQQEVVHNIPRTGEPTSVDLGGDLGRYRVVAQTNEHHDTIVIGMPLDSVTATVVQLALVIGVVTAIGLLVAFVAGTAIVRLALRPLDRVAATATQVAELPLDRGQVALAVRVPAEDADPSTEVGQVGAAINTMLEHVASALTAREASERTVRTFVADASHELRTPLASIRGYSELTRRSGHELPADLAHSLDRIESESIRMTSLVEDLLLLARLDDGRSLESVPVDLSALAADAVSDANAAGQDHEWLLELPDAPLVVTGDQSRLHQVFANLLANARVHTPAGTRVTTALSQQGDTAVLTVTDDGPGIPPNLTDTLFERFVRGDGSRSRNAGSTGLGLAIVSAVVEAHRGSVSVVSAPGATVFRVELPARPV